MHCVTGMTCLIVWKITGLSQNYTGLGTFFTFEECRLLGCGAM
jgi:hypothetical protein